MAKIFLKNNLGVTNDDIPVSAPPPTNPTDFIFHASIEKEEEKKRRREEEEDDDLLYENSEISQEGEQEGRVKIEDEEDKNANV